MFNFDSVWLSQKKLLDCAHVSRLCIYCTWVPKLQQGYWRQQNIFPNYNSFSDCYKEGKISFLTVTDCVKKIYFSHDRKKLQSCNSYWIVIFCQFHIDSTKYNMACNSVPSQRNNMSWFDVVFEHILDQLTWFALFTFSLLLFLTFVISCVSKTTSI